MLFNAAAPAFEKPIRDIFFCPVTLSFRRICYPPAWSIRIYYPINKEEPTPALPKGGSLNEAQYSLTTNRLTFNSPQPPSLGEGLGVGPRLRRITYPPKQIPPSPSLGVIDGVALLVEEWGRRSGYSSDGYVIRLHGV